MILDVFRLFCDECGVYKKRKNFPTPNSKIELLFEKTKILERNIRLANQLLRRHFSSKKNSIQKNDINRENHSPTG